MTQIAPRPPAQKTPRVIDPDHMAFIHRLPCICTGHEGQEIQAHHLMRVPTNERGGARKSGDNWCIPLHWEIHHNLHHCKDGEIAFLVMYGIYGPAMAALLYQLSGNEDACRRAMQEMKHHEYAKLAW